MLFAVVFVASVVVVRVAVADVILEAVALLWSLLSLLFYCVVVVKLPFEAKRHTHTHAQSQCVVYVL